MFLIVCSWRKYFENVNYKIKKATNKQLSDEIVDPDEVKFDEMSKDDQVLNEQNKLLRNTKFEKQIQKTQKSLDFTIKDHQIVVNYYRLSKIEAKFYKIDFEILFSKKPFDKIVSFLSMSFRNADNAIASHRRNTLISNRMIQ